MKLYSENNEYKLYEGNMLDMLEVIPENSIDSIVTDPPYELGFMGKSWDSSGIAFQKETWEKCLKVLKPGGHLLAFGGTRTFHRIACAIEDAGFEIRDCIMWLYGCYSSDTQVLTDKGWKYFYDLDKTEKILQWDKDTNKLSWVKPLNYFEYDIEDDMVRLENRHTEQLLTKNHRVVCDIKKNHKKYNGTYSFIEAQNILKTDFIKLPLASYYYGNLNYEYAYMVGWWLTDAWKHKDGKACMFSQSKPKTLKKLRIELERLKTLGKCNYSEYIKQPKSDKHNPEHTFYVTGELADYLLTNFSSREFKEEFIELNKQSKELLLQGLMDGDGSARDNEYSKVFWSQNESRNDILSALLTTMGYRNYISYSGRHKGVIFNIAHNTTEIQFKHKKPNIKYIGKVYCLQTETGAFVVRRNGKPFISGNSGFPKSMNIGLAIDKKNGVDNKTGNIVKGVGTNHAIAMGNNHKSEYMERKATNEWQGWGTQLKPSYEPIIVARKPVEKSIVENVMKYGVGGMNIDECRVPLEDNYEFKTTNRQSRQTNNVFDNSNCGFNSENSHTASAGPKGRFPANTILTYDETDYEEVCGGFPNTKGSASLPNEEKSNCEYNGIYNFGSKKKKYLHKSDVHFGDSGSAARYFYCAKASKRDRDCDGTINNIHPTCKPQSLMQYLVKLVTPKGGTILDPFNGSGSTGKAVMFENRERDKNYKYIGIELTPDYLPISKARIEYAQTCSLDKEERKEIKSNKNKKSSLID